MIIDDRVELNIQVLHYRFAKNIARYRSELLSQLRGQVPVSLTHLCASPPALRFRRSSGTSKQQNVSSGIQIAIMVGAALRASPVTVLKAERLINPATHMTPLR